MGWGRFNEVDAGFRVEVYVAMPLAVVLSALFALQLLSDVRLWRRLLVQIRKQRSSRARADMTSQRGKILLHATGFLSALFLVGRAVDPAPAFGLYDDVAVSFFSKIVTVSLICGGASFLYTNVRASRQLLNQPKPLWFKYVVAAFAAGSLVSAIGSVIALVYTRRELYVHGINLIYLAVLTVCYNATFQYSAWQIRVHSRSVRDRVLRISSKAPAAAFHGAGATDGGDALDADDAEINKNAELSNSIDAALRKLTVTQLSMFTLLALAAALQIRSVLTHLHNDYLTPDANAYSFDYNVFVWIQFGVVLFILWYSWLPLRISLGALSPTQQELEETSVSRSISRRRPEPSRSPGGTFSRPANALEQPSHSVAVSTALSAPSSDVSSPPTAPV